MDGRFPAKAFFDDYLVKAINLIEMNINIPNETRALKAELINYLQNSSHPIPSNQSCCQICLERQPPDPKKSGRTACM
jgi:hypothetical protein